MVKTLGLSILLACFTATSSALAKNPSHVLDLDEMDRAVESAESREKTLAFIFT